jgi:hypothetical protein
MRTKLISTVFLLAAAACSRDTARDGANTARDNDQSGPVDLSRSGQRVAPAGTYNTGDSSERSANQPGTADTGASAQSTGYTTSGPMGTGGGGYTTGTTSAAGNQGVPTTSQNSDIAPSRKDTARTGEQNTGSYTWGASAPDANANQNGTGTGQQAMNGTGGTGTSGNDTATGDQNQGGTSDTATSGTSGSTTTLGDTGSSDRGTATTAQNTRRKRTTSQSSQGSQGTQSSQDTTRSQQR